MRQKQNERPGQIGEYWLSQRPGRPSWYRTWFDSATRQTRRASLGTEDFQQAKLRLAEWVVHQRQLRDEAPQTVPLESVLVQYWENHAKHMPSAASAIISLRLWSEFFAGASVASVTVDRQESFIAWLRERGHSDGYISRTLSVGRAALNRAYRRQEIKSVPYIIDTEKGPPRERRLSRDEAGRLLNAIELEHLLMYVMIAFNTLARPQAILDLTVFQIDFENRLIDFNPQGRKQTKKYRPVVPITNTLLPWLRSVKSGHVVNWHGRPVESIKRSFHAARKRAGLGPDVSPYTIRHTMATELRRRSVPPWEVAGMLGHRSGGYRTTEIYAKYDPDFLGKAVAGIDAYFVELQPHVRRQLVAMPQIKSRTDVD